MTWLSSPRTRFAGRGPRAALALLAAAACAMFATTAAAQTRSVETARAPARAVLVTPLSFINSRDMEFGRIAPNAVGGTVTVSPTTNACTTSAGMVRIGTCTPAEFAGLGAGGLIARVRLNQASTTLTNSTGQTMLLNDFRIDGSPEFVYAGPGQGFARYRIISSTGIFTFRVGGTLHVAANQAPGVYVGQFSVRLDYQ